MAFAHRLQVRLRQRRLLVLRRHHLRLQVQPVRGEEELVQDRGQQRVLALFQLIVDAVAVLDAHRARQQRQLLLLALLDDLAQVAGERRVLLLVDEHAAPLDLLESARRRVQDGDVEAVSSKSSLSSACSTSATW